jgi:chromosome segregation ATPase
MRYIKTIKLENFQSYKKETIQLTPGLNIILGSSDSGKSAILRAISFVLYNYPRNNTIIHNGANDVKVTLEFSDGTQVTRIRGTRNAYEAIDNKGKKYKLDSIDKAIPDEIKALLNNPPEDDFNGFISYADQFSKMFLVDLSPSDLPRSLSNLTGIEMLEESAKQLMQSYKSIEKQTKSDEKDYVKLLGELSVFDCLEEYECMLEKISQKTLELENLEKQLLELEELDWVEDFSFNQSCINELQEIIEMCDLIIPKIKNLRQEVDNYDKLEIFNLFSKDHHEIDDVDLLESIIENVNTSAVSIQNLQKQINSLIYYEKINQEYQEIKTQGESITLEYKQTKYELDIVEKELKEFKQMLIKEGIQCEICGSILQ